MSRNVCAVLTDSEDVLNRVVLYFFILLSHNWFSLVVVIQKNVSRFIDFFLVELSPIYADMQERHLKKIMSLHSGSFTDV